MNITTTFRQMTGTDAVKSYAQTKVSKLQKFLRQSMRADVTLSVEGNEHVAEVHLKSGPTHLHGSERSEDMYASIDLVVDKLEAQIRRGPVLARVDRIEETALPPASYAHFEIRRTF